MGPPPWSFAADAHDCIMVPIPADRPNTRSWRDLRARWRAPLGLVAGCAQGRTIRPPTEPAGAPRDGQKGSRQRTRRWSPAWSNKEMRPEGTCLTSIAPYKGFGCRPTRRREVHWGRRPEASREGTRGTIGRRACRAHLWGFGRFGSGTGSASTRPSQRSGGVDEPERGIIAVAELARR